MKRRSFLALALASIGLLGWGSGVCERAHARADPVEVWRKTFPVPLSAPGTLDRAVAVATVIDPSSSLSEVFVTGPITTGLNAELTRVKVIRYNPATGLIDAQVLWPNPSSRSGRYIPRAMAVIPGTTTDGGPKVFVAVDVPGKSGTHDCMVVAFDHNLNPFWIAPPRFHWEPIPGFIGDDIPVAIDATGTDVAVTVASMGTDATGPDIHTLTYNSGTGMLGLSSRYASTGADTPSGIKLRTGPLGDIREVYVTGSTGPVDATSLDIVTVGYDILSGATLAGWPQVYDNAGRLDNAAGLAIDNAGNAGLYVTGSSKPLSPGGTNKDYLTLKYYFSGGPPGWTHTYNYAAANGEDTAYAIAVGFQPSISHTNPYEGTFVYVTGASRSEFGDLDAATIQLKDLGASYDPNLFWAARFDRDGTNQVDDYGTSLAIGTIKILAQSVPRQNEVFVGGISRNTNSPTTWDFMTTKYLASSPVQRWKKFSAAPAGTNHVSSGIALLELTPNLLYSFYIAGGTSSASVGDGFLTIRDDEVDW